MGALDWIAVAAVAALFVLAARRAWRNRGRGCAGCGGGCAGCPLAPREKARAEPVNAAGQKPANDATLPEAPAPQARRNHSL